MVATHTPPPFPALAPPGGAPALSPEMAALLIELSASIHKHAIYPGGHPIAAAAVESLAARLAALLRDRPSIAFGVARQQIIVDDTATDPDSPVLRDLAARLYRQGIGAVRIEQGVTPAELREMLCGMAREPAARGAAGMETTAGEARPSLLAQDAPPHVYLAPTTYDQLQILDGAVGAPDGTGAARWDVQLWLGLARSALDEHPEHAVHSAVGPHATEAMQEADPIALARAIDEHVGDPEYDRAILIGLARASEGVRSREGEESTTLAQRISELVAALSPAAIARLLEVGAASHAGPQLLPDGSSVLAVDTVLDLTRAAAASAERTVPGSLLALLGKMARHTRSGGAGATRADAALRQNVRQLVAGWRAGPERTGLDRWDELAELARLRHGPALQRAHPCEPERVVQMSLELGVLGLATRRAVDAMVDGGQLAALLAMMDEAPRSTVLIQTLREHFDIPETVTLLLRSSIVDSVVLERFVARLGTPAIEPLLDALGEHEDRAVRRQVLELLARFGPEIGTAIVRRLPGAPWYLQRNLLLLIGRIGTCPEGFSPALYARHPDARVRREALRLVLGVSALRDAGLCEALGDADERVVRIALTAAAQYCPPAAVSIIARRLDAGSLDPALHAPAIRVLGASAAHAARECLVRLCLSRTRWWRRRRLAPGSPALLAALAALATPVHSTHPAAAQVLALAAVHADAEVRAAAGAAGAAGAP